MSQEDPIHIIDDQQIEIIEPEIVDAEFNVPTAPSCSGCGSPLDPGDRYCPGCGIESETRPAEQADKGLRKYIQCKSCGSTMATDPDKRSYRCGFCDSTYVVDYEPELTGRQNPEFIIGFAISPELAREKFANWIRSNGWFRPADLRFVDLPQKITGIYLPFWSFSMLAESQWNAQIGEYWYRQESYWTTDANGKQVRRTRTVTETEWWPLAGRFHHYYSGYLVSASQGLPQELATKVWPFDLPALKRYEPYFLAGWESEEYTVARETALEHSKHYYHQLQEQNVSRFMPGDRQKNLGVQTYFSQINSDLCLMPYYLLTYHYKSKLYRFLLNGQTGRIWGTKPVSQKRVWGFILGLVGLLALIVLIVIILGNIFGH